MKLFSSYIPRTDGQLRVWAVTYKEKLGQLGPEIGLSPDQVQQLQDDVQLLIGSIEHLAIKKLEQKEATAAKELTKRDVLEKIRSLSHYMKRMPRYSDNIGKELGIVATGQRVDLNSLKPQFHLQSAPGHVRIRFNKYGMLGITIYSRLKGTEKWHLLGRARNSPFKDDTPLAEPGKPEIREYRIICNDGIKEIGTWSDIAKVVYGG